MNEYVDAETYRRNVQRVQAEAMAFGFQHRVRAQYTKPSVAHDRRTFTPRLHAATFDVFWDTWQTIGCEIDPMTPETRRRWDEEAWTKVASQAALELAKG